LATLLMPYGSPERCINGSSTLGQRTLSRVTTCFESVQRSCCEGSAPIWSSIMSRFQHRAGEMKIIPRVWFSSRKIRQGPVRLIRSTAPCVILCCHHPWLCIGRRLVPPSTYLTPHWVAFPFARLIPVAFMLACSQSKRLFARERVRYKHWYFLYPSPYSYHGPLGTLRLLESCFFLTSGGHSYNYSSALPLTFCVLLI
jgi:hypothetical protein